MKNTTKYRCGCLSQHTLGGRLKNHIYCGNEWCDLSRTAGMLKRAKPDARHVVNSAARHVGKVA